MRRAGIAVLALSLSLAIAAASWAEVFKIGRISYVSDTAVEIDGVRALVTPDSLVTSGGRAISLGSLRRGMLGEAEIDDSGQLIVLEVNGVVE